MTKRLVMLTTLAVLVAVVSTHRSVFGQKDKIGWSPVLGPQAAIFNSRLAIQVGSNGRFNMGAFPDPLTGGGQAGSFDLMYRWPQTPGTSFSTIRIDGANFRYGSSGVLVEPPTNIDSATNRSKWQIGDIEVTQIVQIGFNNQTGQEDAARISYTLRNTATASHTVGERVMIDTEINQNDGAPYRIPGAGIITTETEFLGSAVPNTFQAFFNITDSQHVAAGTMVGGGATAPDRFVLARWPQINATDYDYVVTPGVSFTSDSAYAVYWNPTALAPGNSRTYVTFYGLSNVQVDLQPPLALGVSGPAALSVVNNQYSPNPFDVVATIFNNGTAAATNVQLTINLPTGLSLAGGSGTQAIGNLTVGQERQVSWSVRAASQSSQTVLSYSITASASNAQSKTVTKQITLPPALVCGQARPVIIIPGTGGSTLGVPGGRSPNLEGWPGDVAKGPSGNPEHLQFTQDGVPRTDTISNQLEAIGLLRDVTNLEAFLMSNDYELGCNLFAFPYDFRRSVESNATSLADMIQEIKSTTGASKVDIVAHSLGGLVAKQYLSNPANASNVGTFIMLGTPHLGTPKALKVLRYGDELHPLLSPCKVKRAAHNLPGLFDQLPGRRYFAEIGGYFDDRADINGDNVRGVLTDFDRMINTLKDGTEHSSVLCPLVDGTDAEPLRTLSSSLIDQGMVAFHDGLDNWLKPAGVKVYMIAGYGVETISTIIESDGWLRGRIAYPVVTTEGDETVPLKSAERVSATKIYYADLAALGTKHAGMPANTAILDQVLGLLSGSESALGEHITIIRPTGFHTRTLTFSTFSPVRLSVFDSQGNHTGFLADGSSESSIPGSSVTEFGEAQHVSVPEGGMYHVVVHGLDQGGFTLWQTELGETGQLLRTFAWESVPVSHGSVDDLITQFGQPQNLSVDINGDGIPDTSLPPVLYNGGGALLYARCVQDDSNGNVFQCNANTGDYQFSSCNSGFTLTGRCTILVKGSIITLQDNQSDRRVLVRLDDSSRKGTASVQVLSLGTTFTIVDRDTSNNSCSCQVSR